jgi:hypothetical protein
MFCDRAGYLDEFFFCRKIIEKRRLDFARNSYRNEFIDFLPHSYSRASPHFLHGPNYHSMVLVHERTTLYLYALVTAHILIMVIVFYVGTVFLLENFTRALSPDTWMVHVFSVMVHVPLVQRVRCKILLRPPQVAWLSAAFLRFLSLTPALSHRPFLVLCR